MPKSKFSVDKAYAKVVAAFAEDRAVTVEGKSKNAFGAAALRVGDKIFAMVSSKSAFVVKLPRARVDELVAQGKGLRFEPAKGRVMKEWLELSDGSTIKWIGLAKEAKSFVSSQL